MSRKGDKRMPEELCPGKSVVVLIFEIKGDVQSCGSCRGIDVMIHTMEQWSCGIV